MRHLAQILSGALVFFSAPALAGDVKPATELAPAKAAFPYQSGGETLYLKWGDNHAGTPGGMVTWSVMPAGTPGDDEYCGAACPGAAASFLALETAPGGGFQALSLDQLLPYLRTSLAAWADDTGIEFVEVPDNGVPVNNPAAMPPATGQIRFGLFEFAAGGGAVGYAPPPNGGTGAGDVLLNANAFYQLAPGAEGATFDPQFAPNDLMTLLVHEIGHALGLAHPDYDGSCPVMQVHADCQNRINRVPDADDRASAAFLYRIMFRDGFELNPGGQRATGESFGRQH